VGELEAGFAAGDGVRVDSLDAVHAIITAHSATGTKRERITAGE
jgi:hypothetical protein